MQYCFSMTYGRFVLNVFLSSAVLSFHSLLPLYATLSAHGGAGRRGDGRWGEAVMIHPVIQEITFHDERYWEAKGAMKVNGRSV